MAEQKTGLLRMKEICMASLLDTYRRHIEQNARRDMANKLVDILSDGRAYVVQQRAEWQEYPAGSGTLGVEAEALYTCWALVALVHIEDAEVDELAIAPYPVPQEKGTGLCYRIERKQKEIGVDVVPDRFYRDFNIPTLWRRVS